jgi:hypothetical protein
MGEFMVTLIWDADADKVPEGLDEIPGLWVASSSGRLVTGLPATADRPYLACEDAVFRVLPLVDGSRASLVGYSVEPVSATPHFRLRDPLS